MGILKRVESGETTVSDKGQLIGIFITLTAIGIVVGIIFSHLLGG